MPRHPQPTRPPRERVFVCGVLFPDQPEEQEGPLSEAKGLCAAAGAQVVGEGVVQRRERAIPATLFGTGKVEEVAAEVAALSPDAVVVDNDLSPAQVRNLEKAWSVRVIDRSELILDIFARRAQTSQARLQVELAQVEYLLPRLRRMWTHLERQVGGIGTRGPGETQLETDRRILLKRVSDLKRELVEIEHRKRRQVRSRADVFTIGLVGYTNAGKSSLLNRLTGAHELVADMLFATLDTRTRRWKLGDGREVLLSDTVGFLQRLPHHLVASFHATLEEALHVDLLLHVIDASHPDAAVHLAAVNGVLAPLTQGGARILVFNKIDLLEDPIRLTPLVESQPDPCVFVSVKTGEGLDRLERMVVERLDARSRLIEVTIPFADGRTLAAVRGLGKLESPQEETEDGMRMRLRLTPWAEGALRRSAGPDVRMEVLEEEAEPLLAEAKETDSERS